MYRRPSLSLKLLLQLEIDGLAGLNGWSVVWLFCDSAEERMRCAACTKSVYILADRRGNRFVLDCERDHHR
jgi:hypothetical protein